MSLCGIDEAGRGPIAGALVMAGVILHQSIPELNDSKQLSEKKREKLFPIIIENSDYHIVKFTAQQIDEMGIEHGYNVDRVLWLGRQLERTVGQRLRSEAVINGRTLKEGHPKFARPGLKPRKEKLGESPDQKWPQDWKDTPVLPERYRP